MGSPSKYRGVYERPAMKRALLVWVTNTSEVERYLLNINSRDFALLRWCNHKSLGYADNSADKEDLEELSRLIHDGEWKQFKQCPSDWHKSYQGLDGVFVVLE